MSHAYVNEEGEEKKEYRRDKSRTIGEAKEEWSKYGWRKEQKEEFEEMKKE